MNLFCLTQQLTLLRERTRTRPFLSGEQFWLDRHEEQLGPNRRPAPWEELERQNLVQGLTASGSMKQVAVVCAAGLGKSTNLQWLAKELAQQHTGQVPFLFELNYPDLPDTLKEFWDRTLPNEVRKAPGNSGLPDRSIRAALRRLQARGRITLLLDSIDQASAAGLRLVRDLLTSADWARCPLVISARPHAVFDRWETLIVPDETAWQFVRVEPLAEQERRLLLDQDGIRRYARLPPGGQALMANPRNIEYVRKCAIPDEDTEDPDPDSVDQFGLHHLRTASHVFAGAADHMVRYGMRNPKARRLGCRKDRPPPEQASQRQIDFALDLLGALACSMYCLPAPRGEPGEERFRPDVSHVPASRMPAFLQEVLQRIKGVPDLVESDYRIDDLEGDLDALAELNAEIKYDLLDTRPYRHGDFRWYDRSLQEFFAAWWLSRHAGPGDQQRLREWRYDDPRDETGRTLYQPLWGYLVEMPRGVRQEPVWVPAVGILFERKVPRCCEMIHRSWPALSASTTGQVVIRHWQEEFEQLLGASGVQGEVARQIPAGFKRCPANPADDGNPFWMGLPETDEERFEDEVLRQVVVAPLVLHEFPVTNEQYELFDPTHQKLRDQESSEDNQPVIHVSWWDAWSFAKWAGSRLPTEEEWEYACRAGSTTHYYFGPRIYASESNFDFNVGKTTLKGGYPSNRWGLYDMHGNVFEWCNSRHEKMASIRVCRGGSWASYATDCRASLRTKGEPSEKSGGIGFRLARDLVVRTTSASGVETI